MATTRMAKLATAIVLAIAAAAVVASWPPPCEPAEAPREDAAGAATRAVAAAAPGEHAARAQLQPERREVAPVPAAAASPTGALEVHVRHGDASPAAAVTVIVAETGVSSRLGRRAATGADGTARFDALPPGGWVVTTDRSAAGRAVDVRAGETTKLDHALAAGLTIRGVVVETTGAPIPGALVEVASLAPYDADAEVLATSGDDGRFEVRGVATDTLVGARAAGHAASQLRRVCGEDGGVAELTLSLRAPAGVVTGVVVDERGAPVAGAVVKVGAGRTIGRVDHGEVAPPLPALVRTGANGAFRAIGVAPGPQPVQAHAADHAPWAGRCEVAAGANAPLRIELAAAACVRGTVRDEHGDAVAGASVVVGAPDDLVHWRHPTDAAGAFEVRSLPAGEITVAASHEQHGRAKVSAWAAATPSPPLELRLSAVVLRGRVEDDTGAAVERAYVMCFAAGQQWLAASRTAADGGFQLRGCPPDVPLQLSVQADGFTELQRAVAPAAVPVRLRMQRAPPATARMVGAVVGPAGEPIANATVIPVAPDRNDPGGFVVTGPDGRFSTSPLAPGGWLLVVVAHDWPQYVSEPLQLAPNVARDMGTIRMQRAGTARFAVDGDVTGASFVVVSADLRMPRGVREFRGGIHADPLFPGDYRLLVSGATTAAQSIPFTIRTGIATDVAVRLARGVPQALHVVAPPLDAGPPHVRIRVLARDDVVAVDTVRVTAGGATPVSLCLRPGDYSVVASAEDRDLATTSFTVRDHEGPPVLLPLR